MLTGFSCIGNPMPSSVGVSCRLWNLKQNTGALLSQFWPMHHEDIGKWINKLAAHWPSSNHHKKHGIASPKNHKHPAAMSQGLDSANTFNLAGQHLKSSLLEMSVSKLQAKIKEMHLKAISSKSNAAPTTWIKTETVSPLQNYSNIFRLLYIVRYIDTNQA